MTKFLFFNWKSHPDTAAQAQQLARAVAERGDERVAVFPPSVHISAVRDALRNSKVRLGAQNISAQGNNTVTGETTPAMLRDMGAAYVLVGHSERRAILNETDAIVNEKMRSARSAGIVPVVCVGEQERMETDKAIQICVDQLSLDIEGMTAEDFVVAYEPVWAIGGAKAVDPAQAAEVIAGIKKYVSTCPVRSRSPQGGRSRAVGKAASNGACETSHPVSVLYGGSAGCKNISSFLEFAEIDGFLVGSASLREQEVECIISKINNLTPIQHE